MSDYPDHLNPFKRSGGLRESFRSIKTAIGGRFRKKKDHNHGERHSQQVSAANNAGTVRLRHENGNQNGGVPRSETFTGTPEMLPRSRFTERVARAQTMEFGTERAAPPANPFDDDDRHSNSIQVNGTADTERRRRRKKRAPLPPGARAGDRLTVPGDHNSSQWSIDSYTSYDTDYSTTAHTHSENEDAPPDGAERLKDIQEISKEIQVYCDDGKDDNVDKPVTVTVATESETDQGHQAITATSEMTEVTEGTHVEVLSEPEIVETVVKVEEIKSTEAITQTTEADTNDALPNNTTEEVSTLQPIQSESEEQEEEEEEINNNQIQTQDEKVAPPVVRLSNDDDVKTIKTSCETNETTTNNVDVEQEVKEKKETDCDIPKEDVKDISNGLKEKSSTNGTNGIAETAETETNLKLEVHDGHDIDANTKDIAYVNRKSIFIAGSTDNLDLDQTCETTLFITGSCDQLANAKVDKDTTPTPKIRKHKLSREVLLGSVENGLNHSSDK